MKKELVGHVLNNNSEDDLTTLGRSRRTRTSVVRVLPSMTSPPHTEPLPATFAEAVRLFNAREYFACHDVLEELWGETLGEDREFLQGLLHVAVSLHHLSEGNPAGARKMHASSLRYLSNYGSSFRGVDLDLLRSELRVCFEPLRLGIVVGLTTPTVETFPTLRWNADDE